MYLFIYIYIYIYIYICLRPLLPAPNQCPFNGQVNASIYIYIYIYICIYGLPPLPPTSYLFFSCHCVCVFGIVRLWFCGIVGLWFRGLVFCGFVAA